MNALTERYRAMPDELLLKILTERGKYKEAAITTAIAEAEARGFTIPEIKMGDAPFEPIDNRLKEFLQKAQINDQAGMNEDLLDSDVIRKEIAPNKLALKLTVWSFVLLLALELLDDWEDIGALFNDSQSALLLFLPLLIMGCVIVGLWKGFRPAFYLGAGMIVIAALGWLIEIYSLFGDPADALGGLFDNYHYVQHTVYSFWFLLMILKLVLLIGMGWLLCQRTVYQHFGLKQNSAWLAFVFGAMGLLILNYLTVRAF
jgi:hypothetical protein